MESPQGAERDRTVAPMTGIAPTTIARPEAGGGASDQERGHRDQPTWIGEWVAVASWLALIGIALWWGRASIVGRGLGVGAAPLVGRWMWHPSAGLVLPALVGAVVVGIGPPVARCISWVALPLAAGLAASVWTLSLAASDGWRRVSEPLTTRHEYEPFAARIGGAGTFVRHFVERLPGTPIHVQGHPPGAALVPWALDSIGLGGAGWFAALVIMGWGLAVASALVACRALRGEAVARRAAPALVLLPAAVWAGTSADALFAGVLSLGVALAVASRPRTAVGGGLVLGLGMLLTYGALAVVAIASLVQLRHRRLVTGVLVVVAAIAVLVTVAVVSGFSWLDGLDATHRAYQHGVASRRPAGYFALAGNPAALALAAGPAVAVGLVAATRRWRDPAVLLPLTTLLVVLAVDASLMSKGEVERIWLPFVPWLALAAPGHRRWWLAAQVAVALLLQAWLRGPW